MKAEKRLKSIEHKINQFMPQIDSIVSWCNKQVITSSMSSTSNTAELLRQIKKLEDENRDLKRKVSSIEQDKERLAEALRTEKQARVKLVETNIALDGRLSEEARRIDVLKSEIAQLQARLKS